ncbi:helix-turn-helix domain-containing protein [Tsukamurella tyrosinosolvens]|uniref:helix-turn-helix domain-containing protein n=1 Tax=Tsukamurella tyrosinosolvens TaxID=57704 RepID=UPI003F49E313
MDEGDELTLDEAVGASIQRLRTEMGLSQSDLAARLKQRGLAFRQQTVANVESGTRPLKFVEALVVSQVLEVEPWSLVAEGVDLEAVLDEKRLAAEFWQAADALGRAIDRFDDARNAVFDAVLTLKANGASTAPFADLAGKAKNLSVPVIFEMWQDGTESDGADA